MSIACRAKKHAAEMCIGPRYPLVIISMVGILHTVLFAANNLLAKTGKSRGISARHPSGVPLLQLWLPNEPAQPLPEGRQQQGVRMQRLGPNWG